MEKGLKKMKERKKGSTSRSPWTPFTPQPLHGKLKKFNLVQSSNEFMDSPLNHLFGMWQERVHMEPSQLVDKEARVEQVWIFNLFAMEALRSQS